MAEKRRSEPRLEVKLVSVEADDADARLRLAYKLLLKAGARSTLPGQIEYPNRTGGVEEMQGE